MGTALILIGIVIMLYIITSILQQPKDTTLEKWEEQRENYLKAVGDFCSANGFQMCPQERRWRQLVDLNGRYRQRWVWYDKGALIFCTSPDDILSDISAENNVCVVPRKDIEFFTRQGDISYTNQIVNKGKNISVSGAIVGGLIAGDAGAIIGANKEANKLENKTVAHDNRETVVYYRVGSEVKTVIADGKSLYMYLLEVMPDKEYAYVQSSKIVAQNNSRGNDVKERIEKIDELHKMGLITDDEYKAKRSEIISSL